MALVIQTIAASGQYVPFERPPDNLSLWSAIPRGLQTFFVDGQQLDLKPVNDDFLLQITALLPPNYGYVMNDINFTIAISRAVDWSGITNLNLQNFYRGTQNLAISLSGNWVNTFSLFASGITGTTRVLGGGGSMNWPTSPMIGAANTTGIQVNFSAVNGADTVSPSGIVNFWISFWQFDLEQIRKYPVNAPIPIHAR